MKPPHHIGELAHTESLVAVQIRLIEHSLYDLLDFHIGHRGTNQQAHTLMAVCDADETVIVEVVQFEAPKEFDLDRCSKVERIHHRQYVVKSERAES